MDTLVSNWDLVLDGVLLCRERSVVCWATWMGFMQINSIGIQIMMAALLVSFPFHYVIVPENLIGGKDPQSIVADEYLTLPICVIGFSSPLFLISGFVFLTLQNHHRLEMCRVYLAVGVWWLMIYWLRYLLGAVMPFWRMELVFSKLNQVLKIIDFTQLIKF